MINIFAPINPTGYGVHATNLLGALSEIEEAKNFRLYPIGQFQYEGKYKQVLLQAIERGRNHYDSSQPGVCLWHANDMARFSGSPRIAYTVFELDRLKPDEIKQLMQVDAVMTASMWGGHILNDCLQGFDFPQVGDGADKPIYVVPEGVDPDVFTYDADRDSDLKSGISLLNIGKFEQRKGHIHILDAMTKTQTQCDLTALWHNFFIPTEHIIKTIMDWGFINPSVRYLDSNELTPSIKTHLFTHPNGNSIYLVDPNHNNPNFIRELINESDAGLFPYAAEGWNLPLIECMASGLPCIATDYGGPTEYLTPTNHIPLKNQGLVPASDGVFFKGEGKWASVSVDEIVEKIDTMTEDQLSSINNELKGFGEKWKWSNAARQFLQAVNHAQSMV